ncbi:MAG TPA: hypothetical protein VFB38_22130 [Chthonomonadaceae bacterium]|nr:hypothetical protein [Chthonomonadaceae bacterium]
MPTAQQHTRPNAFAPSGANTRSITTGYSAYTGHTGRRQAPATAPARPAPRTGVSVRPRMQTTWLILMVLTAFAFVVVGLAYLYGYALVTKEGYRRAQLKSMLRRERELAQQWKQQLALTHTPMQIEQRARALGMVHANDQEAITVGAIPSEEPWGHVGP